MFILPFSLICHVCLTAFHHKINVVVLKYSDPVNGRTCFGMGASVGGKHYCRVDTNTRETPLTSTVWELSFKTGTPCIGHYCKVALLSGHPSRSSRKPLNVDTLYPSSKGSSVSRHPCRLVASVNHCKVDRTVSGRTKKQRRRRLGKPDLKSEFALPQT